MGRNITYEYNDKSSDTNFQYYGYSAFANISSTTLSVTIGPKVTRIQPYSFYGCAGLSKVTINSDITSIGNNAFNGCAILDSIEIPETVSTIGNSAFANCKKLKAITIPASVTSIENYAFNGCTGMKTLELEDGENELSLGYNSFNDYWNDKQKGLFRDCGIETLYVGRNITYEYNDKSSDTNFQYYGYSAFANISTLTTVTINVSEGVSAFTIGKYAFKGCSNINSATFKTPKGETWGWYTSSSGTATTGTTVDVSTTTAAASVLKNLGENYLHGKQREVVTIEVQAPEATL